MPGGALGWLHKKNGIVLCRELLEVFKTNIGSEQSLTRLAKSIRDYQLVF